MLERDDDFVLEVCRAAQEEQSDILLAARIRDLVKERKGTIDQQEDGKVSDLLSFSAGILLV